MLDTKLARLAGGMKWVAQADQASRLDLVRNQAGDPAPHRFAADDQFFGISMEPSRRTTTDAVPVRGPAGLAFPICDVRPCTGTRIERHGSHDEPNQRRKCS